jgi:membrane protein DedA with SNARE-associated domain
MVNFEKKGQIILAATVTLGFFGLIIFMMGVGVSATIMQPLMMLLGTLSAAFGAVIQYFFGSSSGSARKDELLLNAVPNNANP